MTSNIKCFSSAQFRAGVLSEKAQCDRKVEGARSARTMPAVREAALPTAAPHQLWLRMGQAGARLVAVLATVGPMGADSALTARRRVPYFTCAHESAEGHRLGGVRQRSAPWL